MKKLLGIVVLGLLWSSFSFADVEKILKNIKKNKDIAQGYNKVKGKPFTSSEIFIEIKKHIKD